MNMGKDTEQKHIEPVFHNNSVAIAASSSKEYVPYLAVWLQSLVEHATDTTNYDIVIFESTIGAGDKSVLLRHFQRHNISLRFFNPSHYFDVKTLSITHTYFSVECYYRLAAPLVFRKYPKLIFTDIDIIFNCDIQELYHMDIQDSVLASCKELLWDHMIATSLTIEGIDIATYSRETLNFKDSDPYFNTGVILFDVPSFLKGNYFATALSEIAQTRFLYQEQCVLNKICKSKIFELPVEWNFHASANTLAMLLEGANEELAQAITSASDNPKIYHFLGRLKPWHTTNLDYVAIWWGYARRSPFYEELLARFFNDRLAIWTKQLFQILNIKTYRLKFWRYRLLSKICIGARRKKYKQKKRKYRAKLNASKAIYSQYHG